MLGCGNYDSAHRIRQIPAIQWLGNHSLHPEILGGGACGTEATANCPEMATIPGVIRAH